MANEAEGKAVSHTQLHSLGSGTSGERENSRPRQLPNQPRCPECGSSNVVKAGFRLLWDNTPVQRWLCKNCGVRSTEKGSSAVPGPLQENSGLDSYRANGISDTCRVNDDPFWRVAGTRQVQSLATVETRNEKPLRDGTHDLPGTLVDFAWRMKKRGLAEETIKHRIYRLGVLIRKGADLQNPDSVETVLATEPWKPSNKRFFVMAYQSFTKTFNIPWTPIRIKYESKQPFIPLESEIDQLIASCGKRTSTFLQVLKDTGARCGEAKNLQWTDVDDPKKVIRINDPEKGSNSRTVHVTPKTLAMLNALPKRGIYVFSPQAGTDKPPKIRSITSVFSRQRNRLAVRIQNPRLKQIHFHTLRHWKATMEYAKTRDILYVKQLLGHKRLENTEVYTHLVDFATEDYTVRRPKASKEEDELIEAGFEYVRYDDKEQCPIYRKRK